MFYSHEHLYRLCSLSTLPLGLNVDFMIDADQFFKLETGLLSKFHIETDYWVNRLNRA